YRAGKLQRAQYGKVVSYGLGTQLGADAFDIRFPPGAIVLDEKARRQYIVRKDDSAMDIGRGKAGLSYDELLAADAKDSEAAGRRWLLVWISAGVALLALAGYWLSRSIFKKKVA
ncbi:MAG: hypothetical protein K2W96_09285, partial [Gemmataceae bacterium]|nr:hypothetical protein [Gemmataceae bacterium]